MSFKYPMFCRVGIVVVQTNPFGPHTIISVSAPGGGKWVLNISLFTYPKLYFQAFKWKKTIRISKKNLDLT